MKIKAITATLATLVSSMALAGTGALGEADGPAGGSKAADCKQAGQGSQAGSGAKKARCYTDAQILERLHASNLHEIRASRLAIGNSKDEDVLAYARMMIEMHTAADGNVRALAGEKNVALAARPRPIDSRERAEMRKMEKALEELGGLEGESFDEAYAGHMVESHAKALANLDVFEKATSDEKLDALIGKFRPTVEAHLEEARDLVKDQRE